MKNLKDYTVDELVKISKEKGQTFEKTIEELKNIEAYEHYSKLTKFYVVHGFNNEGKKIQEYCYLTEEFADKSQKFKNFVHKYDSAVKTADLSKGPSFKLLMMKKKLEKLEKKEQIKKYTIAETNRIVVQSQKKLKEIESKLKTNADTVQTMTK